MIVDGKAIAAYMYAEVKTAVAAYPRTPVLAAITCAPTFETKKYLALKQAKAAEVGITLRLIELPDSSTTEAVITSIAAIAATVDGVVVQLPFPSHIDREAVLAAIPPEKDPDGFSYGRVTTACLPPVVGAIAEIARVHNISFVDKQVVVLGHGRLVGAPAAEYMKQAGASVTVLTEVIGNPTPYLATADVLISGIGKPHTIKKEQVRPGTLVFDAGTSEDGGVVVGDVHPEVATIASLFTPVPGGIGPITVAVLLRNLINLLPK